jgi:hypothetical protein
MRYLSDCLLNLNEIKEKKQYHVRLYILEILSKNKYFLFLKIKLIYIKHKKIFINELQ